MTPPPSPRRDERENETPTGEWHSKTLAWRIHCHLHNGSPLSTDILLATVERLKINDDVIVHLNECLTQAVASFEHWKAEAAASQAAQKEIREALRQSQKNCVRANVYWVLLDSALWDLKNAVKEFCRGVADTKWEANEPRVVGYKLEFDQMKKELSKEKPSLPELPTDAFMDEMERKESFRPPTATP